MTKCSLYHFFISAHLVNFVSGTFHSKFLNQLVTKTLQLVCIKFQNSILIIFFQVSLMKMEPLNGRVLLEFILFFKLMTEHLTVYRRICFVQSSGHFLSPENSRNTQGHQRRKNKKSDDFSHPIVKCVIKLVIVYYICRLLCRLHGKR